MESLGGEEIQKDELFGFAIAAAYGLTSASMAFLNKSLLTVFLFDAPIVIMLVQMIFMLIILQFLKTLKKINLVGYSLSLGRQMFLPSVLYACHSILALWALKGMNIPMYGAIKRLAPVVTLGLGIIVLNKPKPSKTVFISVIAVTVGCLLAAYGDLKFDALSYASGGASVLFQAGYLVCVQRESANIPAIDAVYVNALHTAPLFAILSLFELSHLAIPTWSTIFMLCTTTILGCVLNYLLFLCTMYNSALTTSITGVLKSVAQTAIGWFTFEGISANFPIVSGICINIFGGLLYTYAKHVESKKKSNFASEIEQGRN
ncbi:unnamed protein product [Dimorphilus gyrociliatus]|uniref:Uncharacterized protein n=1 Tax=Dimorphilus gyrociliatus TaxID=2664684 RepID=A0A7I8W7N9_9ANNE|nr:unnamed protein product [Dimorphilus gyrociliatus]